MKKQKIVGIVLAATLAGGIGVLANVLTSNDAASAESRPTTSSAAPTSAADLELSPGAAGPVKVGDSMADAIESGLFDSNLPAPVEGCPTIPLEWKEPFAGTFDVQSLPNGDVASIGVRKAGPKTADGLGIGSTLADVLAVTKGKAVEAGYGQTGVLVYDATSQGWIGYLFDTEVANASDNDTVSFIELTNGEKPGLMRDGC